MSPAGQNKNQFKVFYLLFEIMPPTDLSNLYIKKYIDLLESVRVMVSLYATTVSLIKLTFYIKNKSSWFEALTQN